jgi:hypothetical protein
MNPFVPYEVNIHKSFVDRFFTDHHKKIQARNMKKRNSLKSSRSYYIRESIVTFREHWHSVKLDVPENVVLGKAWKVECLRHKRQFCREKTFRDKTAREKICRDDIGIMAQLMATIFSHLASHLAKFSLYTV